MEQVKTLFTMLACAGTYDRIGRDSPARDFCSDRYLLQKLARRFMETRYVNVCPDDGPTLQLKVPEFDVPSKQPWSVLFLGGRASGKTTAMRDVIFRMRHIFHDVRMSDDAYLDDNRFWTNAANKFVKTKMRTAVIFDDLETPGLQLTARKSLYNGRSFGISTFICTSCAVWLSPHILDLFDYIFVAGNISRSRSSRAVPLFREHRQIAESLFANCTRKLELLVFNGKPKNQEELFDVWWFKAKQRGPFKVAGTSI
jgi:hypothetical protein